MPTGPDTAYPADICLLLRSHAEELWLSSQVLPLVRQLEQPGVVPDEQLGAATAYLEVLWVDARRRCTETEAAFRELLFAQPTPSALLHAQARTLHAAVRVRREHVALRVAGLLAPPSAPCAHEQALT
jgi:hypothetical protein